MIKVLFICHGNICRSTMAEFVFKKMTADLGLADEFCIQSAATSREEIGNPIHSGTQKVLRRHGVPFDGHRAVQITQADYVKFDYILTMDKQNITNALRIFGGDPLGKVRRLLSYTEAERDIADPWYSGNFDITYDDIVNGCRGFLVYLREKGGVEF